MKKLNENGIKKIINYIGRDDLMYSSLNGKHVVIGNMTEHDNNLLEDINIKLIKMNDEVDGAINLYEAELDDVEVGEVDKNDNVNISNNVISSDNEIAGMAEKMIPYLAKVFPTKEQVNKVLNDLLVQMIDPDEMIDGLKKQIQRIKRQSREDDEVG